jgi:hypothetical protein
VFLSQDEPGKHTQRDGRQGQAGQEMDQHDSSLQYGVSCRVEFDPTLTGIERKAFAAMVNIDASDGGIFAV